MLTFLPLNCHPNPKDVLIIGGGDGGVAREVVKHPNSFDVIISDTSDPVGPAERLFSTEYYKLMHNALRDGGLLAVQGECMFLHEKLIGGLMEFCNGLYAKSAYATGYVP